MAVIGFIGLGIMGSPMAVNLQRAGHEVRGWNRTARKTAALVEAGGRAAATIADAVTGAGVVCLNVSDSSDVEDVLTGPDGVLEHAAPGTVVLDFSTIRPDVTRRLAEEAASSGVVLLDAPVSGGELGAQQGILSIMVGGPAEAFAQVEPVLRAVGRTVRHVGQSGAGQTVKAANQLIVAGHVQMLAEAVAFLEATGTDTEVALEVLAGGMAGSRVMEQKQAKMRDREFTPGFTVDLHHKDLGIVAAAAREVGVITPLTALVGQLMASARANGDGDLDHSALLKGVLRLSGRDVD